MLAAYLQHQAEREKSGIPALPLTPEQTAQVCQLLLAPPKGQEALLLSLLTDRVSPGVDPSAKVKAAFLADVVFSRVACPLITPTAAIDPGPASPSALLLGCRTRRRRGGAVATPQYPTVQETPRLPQGCLRVA